MKSHWTLMAITAALAAACSDRGPPALASASAAPAVATRPAAAGDYPEVDPEFNYNPASQSVVINRRPLPSQAVAALARVYGQIRPGNYWYDAVSGLWGPEGGPTMGQIAAGLPFGPMPANISGGRTGTYINGREIHPLEYQALARTYGQVWPGRFWLTADGTWGREGGPAMGNMRAGAGGGGGGGGGAWSTWSDYAGGGAGGDSNGCMYFNGGDTSWSNC